MLKVDILTREILNPHPHSLPDFKPYKLPLFSQFTPTTYTSIILFYPNNGSDGPSNAHAKITRLKKSVLDALTLYYPLFGREVDNHFVDRFEEGVLFLEARVDTCLSEFLKNVDVELLNKFLPRQPFRKESKMGLPIVAFQANVFACGGLALGWVASHKVVDGPTAGAFLVSWASICRGSLHEIMPPSVEEGSLFFPPRNPFPNKHVSLMETLWFAETNCVTRRFVFDAKAVALLKLLAAGPGARAGGGVVRPSRIEAVSCFIWKCFMDASRATTKAPKPSIMVQAVNLRQRTKPPMSKSSVGDLFWWATAVSHPSDPNMGLHELVKMAAEAIAVYDEDYMEHLQGEEGFETIDAYCDQLEGLFSLEKPDILAFTSWCHLGFPRTDFGWGMPFWVAALGKPGPAFRNLTIFIDSKDGLAIEAWAIFDQQRMAVLENNPEFLAFASPNPKISNL